MQAIRDAMKQTIDELVPDDANLAEAQKLQAQLRSQADRRLNGLLLLDLKDPNPNPPDEPPQYEAIALPGGLSLASLVRVFVALEGTRPEGEDKNPRKALLILQFVLLWFLLVVLGIRKVFWKQLSEGKYKCWRDFWTLALYLVITVATFLDAAIAAVGFYDTKDDDTNDDGDDENTGPSLSPSLAMRSSIY